MDKSADLQRAACSEAMLDQAFHTFAYYQEEQARAEADLLERETWTLTTILNASEPIWAHKANSTLRFAPEQSGRPLPYHLELGRFAHLAALEEPSADEQALIDAAPCCWARVSPHVERQLAGQTGALACSYVRISIAEAVSLLGFGRIMAQIEAATRETGQALLATAQAQDERQQRLLAVERMLGWAPDPATEPMNRFADARARLVVALVGPGSQGRWIAGAVIFGIVVVLVYLII